MADLRDIVKAHKTGSIRLKGTAENEADYNANVTATGVTKLSWSELQTEMAKVAYVEKRQGEYPQLAEQFDMLFRDIAANKVTTDGELYKTLSKVKLDHPKPG